MSAATDTASHAPASDPHADADLLYTPLHDRHVAAGARIVPFAGYAMPVQYPQGILAEHKWTREKAGLFDVSHMGQAVLVGPDHATTALALEALIPADILNLAPGKQRYSQLLADDGGILDDLMVARSADPADEGGLMLIVNAACKAADYAHIAARLPANVKLHVADDRALIALQGPASEAALVDLGATSVAAMTFMDVGTTTIAGIEVGITRSGYTGEDGFEISVSADHAVAVWDALVGHPDVEPIGLGARDSLRLEAGLCLYGHDIDTTTSPVEAALVWSMQKRRREEGGFPGFDRIARELRDGPSRLRVGLKIDGRMPVREGAPIHVRGAAEPIGIVTSGGFGPSVGAPVAMGYVTRSHSAIGTELDLIVRGKAVAATVTALPFVPARFRRAGARA
jgi:aminomethyltransferase